MMLLPVIERELRAESRHALTYLLRLCGAGFLIFLLCVASGDSVEGKQVFWMFHALIFFLVWIAAPLATFDSLSREKREGTLGLLFLTPLRPPDIVMAKALVQAIRLLGVILGTVPVMCIPLLMGGVGWVDAAISLLINGSSVLCAIAAGLLASSFCRRMSWALVCAFGLSSVYLLVLNFLLPWVVLGVASIPLGLQFRHLSPFLSDSSQFFFGAHPFWNDFLLSFGIRTQTTVLVGVCIVALICCSWFVLNLFLAGEKIRRTWQGKQPTPRQMWLEQNFCSPVVSRSFFRRWLGKKLERNPVGWLEQRSWTGRVVKWGWLGLIVVFYSLVLGTDDLYREIRDLQNWAFVLLLASLGVSAALSFRRERETGLLELMLVSPLQAETIVSGRIRGLWSQFAPALSLLVVSSLYLHTALMKYDWRFDETDFVLISCLCVSTFVALPGISLYFSLRLKHLLAGLVASFCAVCLFPAILGVCTILLLELHHRWAFSGIALASQLCAGFLFYRLLVHDLRARRFALEKTGAG